MRIIIPILFFVVLSNSFSLERNNFFLLDSLSKEFAEEIISDFKNTNVSEMALVNSEEVGFWLLEQNLVVESSKNKIKIFDPEKENVAKLKLNIVNFRSEYKKHNSNDSIIRVSLLHAKPIVNMPDGTLSALGDKTFEITEVISKEEAVALQGDTFDFDKAEFPSATGKFYKKYVEPAIVIGSAAIAIFLFFTVRSG